MSALGFCRECGNIVQHHYSYCPFCGVKKDGAEPAPARERQAKPDVKARTAVYMARLKRLEERLAVLDRELDAFIVRPR